MRGPDRTQGFTDEEKDQINQMVEWFQEEFEDPANQTPYETAEGGYQWIWGGPFDAREEIGGEFVDVDERLIDAAVEIVETGGMYEWAPSSKRIEDERLTDQEDYNGQDASAASIRIFNEMQAEIVAVEATLQGLSPALPGMGHNNPPENIEATIFAEGDRREIQSVLATLGEQEPMPDSPPPMALAATTKLREIALRLGERLAKNVGVTISTAEKTFFEGLGKTMGNGALAGVAFLVAKLLGVLDLAVRWLETLGLPF